MAQRRMFSPDIVCSDAFLDMPASSCHLYYQLGMYADDDGFVNPRKIMRMLGSSEDDLKVLLAKRFLLSFQSGVVVVKHWKINNLVRKDWYRPTQYVEEKDTLYLKEGGTYTDNPDNGTKLVNDSLTVRQHRLGKVRLGKNTESPYSSLKYLLDIPDEEVSSFKEKYEASNSQIKRKAEQMYNYCLSKGKTYKNYKAFLENGLDKDFGRKIKSNVSKEPEILLTQEQKERIEKRKEEINAIFRR